MQRKVPLRSRNTLENRLWARLRALEGTRFRRKSPFKSFTLDFVEHDAKLVISLEDGEAVAPDKGGARPSATCIPPSIASRWCWKT